MQTVTTIGDHHGEKPRLIKVNQIYAADYNKSTRSIEIKSEIFLLGFINSIHYNAAYNVSLVNLWNKASNYLYVNPSEINGANFLNWHNLECYSKFVNFVDISMQLLEPEEEAEKKKQTDPAHLCKFPLLILGKILWHLTIIF